MSTKATTKSSRPSQSGGQGRTARTARKPRNRRRGPRSNVNRGNPPLAGSNSKVAAPIAKGSTNLIGRPYMSTSSFGDGAVRVRHREYVADVSSPSVAYASTTYPIQPGSSVTFPWLSRIAANYESYIFRKLSFEYESQTSTSTPGTAMLAADYDASDLPPTSKAQLMSYQGAVRSPLWSPCTCVCDTADLQKFGTKRYVRTGAVPANTDVKTYDVGNMFMATQGNTADPCGELYVDYDIELQTPQTDSIIGLGQSARLVSASPTPADPFNSAVITGTLPLTTSVAQVLSFPSRCQVLVSLLLAGTAINLPTATISAGSNYTLISSLLNGTSVNGSFVYLLDMLPSGTLQLDTTTSSVLTSVDARFGSYEYPLG